MKWELITLLHPFYTFSLVGRDCVEVKLTASSLIGAKFRMCHLLGKTEGIDVEFDIGDEE